MQKITLKFLTKAGFVTLFLIFSLFFLGVVIARLAQAVPAAEICNGLDDNGDEAVDEGVDCEHYLSYLLDKSINPINVVLRDQFIDPTDFTLVLIERLLNPVRKLHEEIEFNPKRPNLHYLAYRLQSSAAFIPRAVFIENQFEKRNITLTKPRYLLTPTGKRKTGIPIERILSNVLPIAADKIIASIVPSVPQKANHYLCYDVEPYDIGKGVSGRDQFQNKQFEVTRARYLCNPVEKTHNEKVSEIVDKNNHLMCYEVIPHNQINRKVITRDQFGIRSQNPVRTEEICLPTIKNPLPNECIRPDEDGTAVIFDAGTKYQNTDGQFMIVAPSLATTGLTADASLMSGLDTIITRSGNPEDGEIYAFDTEMLQLGLSGTGRVLNLPTNGEIRTSPRTPGNPMQSFDTEMRLLQGQLPAGDPDFDLLRVTAGGGFGLPSPGHTTLTQLPGGNWNVDSFFDITYRVDFVGAPGGAFSGQSDSITGTVRLGTACLVPPGEE